MPRDFNDILREEGGDAVRNAFDNARTMNGYKREYIYIDPEVSEGIKRTARGIDKLLWLRDIELVTRSNYLIKDLLFEGDLSFWFGESGAGKSFLLTDIAAHIAAGRTFLGRRVRQTGVLIVPLEGQRGAKRRLYAIRETFGDDLKLAIYEHGLDLSSSHDDVGRLIRTMKRDFSDCGFLIIDTLSRMLGSGSDSDPKDMNRAFQQFARIQRETGVHIAVIHHPGHGDKDRPRGMSNIKPNTDTLTRIDRAGGGDISTAVVLKQKDGEEGERIAFRLKKVVLGYDDDGDEISTCTVEYIDVPTQETNGAKDTALVVLHRAFNEALRIHGREHEPFSSPDCPSPVVIAVPLEVVRQEFYRRWCVDAEGEAKAHEARKRAFNRALKNSLHIYRRENVDGEQALWRLSS